MSFQKHVFANGLTLVGEPSPSARSCAVGFFVRTGARDESAPESGVSHFLEHMVFKGTARRSARDLSFEIENAGGQLNACTSEDQTVYEGHGEADLMPVLVDVLSDMVWHATFPEAEIELEREVIGEEITMYKESPADHIGDLISAALWGNHPLGNPISGSLESITAINRKVLLDFRNHHHFRSEVVIAAAGPFTLDEILQLILPHLPPNFHHGQKAQPFDRTMAQPQTVHDTRETDQLQLALAWHTPGRRSPTRHALRMLSMMLGETASSRLFLELREERGLCYQISSDVTFFDETGAFEISAGLDPEAREEALACIYREIDDLVTRGPRPGELDRVKRLTIAQSKLAFETTGSHAGWAGEGVLDFGHVPSPADWRAKIMAVTDAEVQAVAREIFLDHSPARAEIGESKT